AAAEAGRDLCRGFRSVRERYRDLYLIHGYAVAAAASTLRALLGKIAEEI
ncbi:MAG: hypothetical protein QOJ96_1553, partial [Alphaproteobacteria bacterium]|nr:hypothetical protein [Alphaproteobacteria bacterium]